MIESGRVVSVLMRTRDITSERAAVVALAAKGGRDSLTGLAKRAVLEGFVDALIRRGHRFHMLFMDLDRFKSVNDTMGHKAGDLVLERVARVLQSVTRAGDLAVRLGGDEFVIVLGESQNPTGTAERLRARVLEVTEPFGAGASVGTASYPDDGTTCATLLDHADRAMYAAKVMSADRTVTPTTVWPKPHG